MGSILSLEKKYSSIYDKRDNTSTYKFGFDEIEALVSFYYNTPNNTLGLFWQNLTDFQALFERHKKKSTTLHNMRVKAEQNKQLQLNKPFIRNAENYKLDIFMVYCVSKERSFDIYEACEDFGLTEKQINDIFSVLLKKKYLTLIDGKYSATDLLKKYLYSSRIKTFKSLYYKKPSKNEIQQTQVSYIPKNFKNKFKGYKN